MIQEQIEKTIMAFWDLPLRADGFQDGRPNQHAGHAELAKALAEYIVAELGPTVDEVAELDATLAEVVAAMTKHNEQQKLPFATLTVFAHGGGSVRDGNGQLFHWPNSDNPGRTAIEVIQAHTKPEPTAAERFDEVAVYAQNWRAYLQRADKPSSDIGTSIDVVRKVLEAK